MSTINTNNLDVNYPVPGVNNNSQGFRDNFASIKTNLNTAGAEITDLQNKVVLKSSLNNTTLDNDMNNALISNALTRGFRSTTYNLGSSLSGVVLVNVTLGDVQYGTITGDTTLQFAGWAPSGTQSSVQLQLSIGNSQAVLSFPAQVTNGVTSLENYANVAGTSTVTAPYGVTTLDYRFSTIDCGNTIIVEPYNNSRISSQIQQRSPAPTGFQGDVAGDVAIDTQYFYVCTGSFNSGGSNTVTKSVTATSSSGDITLNNTNSLVVNNPIIFTGTPFGGIVAGKVYYIKTIVSTVITVSETRTAGVAGATFTPTNVPFGTPFTATSYNGSNIWKRISLTSW